MERLIRILLCCLCVIGISDKADAQISSVPTNTFGGILDYKMAAVSFQDKTANGSTSCNTATALTKSLVISGVPAGATIKSAYLYWATLSIDNQLTFNGSSTTAGTSWLDHLITPGGLLGGAVDQYAYFYKADVTSKMSAAINGSYPITSLTTIASVASGGGCLAGAVLIVVYNTTLSDPNYLNALYFFEGTKGIIGPAHSPTTGQTQFATITLNTLITQTAAAKFSDVVWMGGSIVANTAYDDSLSINSIPLTDANNPGNDQFNGSGTNNAPLSAYNVDADTYPISSMITAGSSTVKMRARSKQNDYYVINAFVVGLRRFADWGDAPDSYGTYAASNGPLHFINTFPGQLMIGSTVNSNSLSVASNESDGQPGAASLDSDDGNIVFSPITTVTTTYSVSVPITKTMAGNAYLAGYIDFNSDGDFLDAGERSNTATVTASGNYTLNFSGFTVSSAPANTYARFRVSGTQTAVESPLGMAPDGEVEDYPTAIVFLPLNMLSFSATTDKKEVNLNWSTASEKDVKEFVVERAGNNAVFNAIGTVAAAGNSAQKNDYTFEDKTAEPGKLQLYRLKEIDYNGSAVYSKTVSAKIPASAEVLSAALNGNALSLSMSSETETSMQVKLYNAAAEEMFSTQITLNIGAAQQFQFAMPELPPGVYLLSLENTGAEAIRIKLVK